MSTTDTDSDEDILNDIRHQRLEEQLLSDPERESLLIRLTDASHTAQRHIQRKDAPFIVRVNRRTTFPVFTASGAVRLQGDIGVMPFWFDQPSVFRTRSRSDVHKSKKERQADCICALDGDAIHVLVLIPLRLFRRTIKSVVALRHTLKNIAVIYFPCQLVEDIRGECVVCH